MPIDDIRLALSLAVIGQQILVALVFLKSQPRVPAQWLGALLLLGAAAYLIQSNAVLRDAFSSLLPITAALALAVPYLLWEFSIATFEIRSFPGVLRLPIYSVAFFVWIAVINDPTDASGIPAFAVVLHQLVGLTLILHAMISVYRDRRDDLLEPRRRYRALFILLIAVQAGAVLLTELLLGYANVPDWLEFTNVVMIELLTLGLCMPLLTLDGRVLWQNLASNTITRPTQPTTTLTSAEDRLGEALQASMAAGFYRTGSIGIRDLAAELKAPEHVLRKVINQHLGYRNFSVFLNYHRINEAKLRLADAEIAHIPILTIAMDLGYGSIGPFNRAFKTSTGLTPTAFRRSQPGCSSTDSG